MGQKQRALALGLFLSAGAYATSVNFTFDTQVINGTTITGLGSGANAGAIQTYMNAVLSASGCSGCSAQVLASGSIGAVADQTWNGDGAVTGPGTGNNAGKTSLTLGDSTGSYTAGSTTTSTIGATDTFIANTSDGGGTHNGAPGGTTTTSQITILFKGITGLAIKSFDYEIFPDISCPQLTSSACGGASTTTPSGFANQPDLEFAAGNNTTGTVGSVAGDDTIQNTYYGVKPGTTNGNAVNSPSSGHSSSELAPQLIGTWTGSLTGVSELDFVDWPATIGIDNLNISFSTPVPEPASIVLLGTLVALVATKLRKA